MAVPTLRQWRNGEIFNARDYVYERNLLVAEINRLEGLFTGSSDLSVSSITMGGKTITSFAQAGTKIHYQTLPADAAVDDLFIDYD